MTTVQRASDGEIVGLSENLLRNIQKRLEYQRRQSTSQEYRRAHNATRKAIAEAKLSTIQARAIEHASANIKPYWGEYVLREPRRYEHSEYGLQCREYCAAFDKAIQLDYVNAGARLPRNDKVLPEHRIP